MYNICVIERPQAGFFNRLHNILYMKFFDYLRDTKAEMAHIKWPSRRTAIVFTILVVLVSLGFGIVLGFFDFIFSRGLTGFIN